MSPELKQLVKARRSEIARDLAAVTKLTVTELQDMVENPKSIGIQAAIAAVLLKATLGDAKALSAILDRIIGKPKEIKFGP